MHKMQEERDQRKKLLQFFMGLNESFTAARGQTLMINPLPSVPQAYSFVKEEERQRMGHNTTQSFTANVKNNSQTSKMQSSVPNNTNDSLTKRATLKCVYCHKEGHQHSLEQLEQQVAQMSQLMTAMINNKVMGTPEDHVAGLAYSMLSYSPHDSLHTWIMDTDDSTHAIEFNSSQFLVKHKGIVLTSGTQKGGLYYLFVNTVIPHINNVGPSVNNLPSKLWHLRLVHAPHDILKHITSLDISAPCSKDCLVCPTAKQSMLPFPKHSSSHANSPFILVHMDVWGSYKVTTTEGCRYRDEYRDKGRRRSRSRSRDRSSHEYRGRDRDYHHRSRNRSLSPDYRKDRERSRYDDARRSRSRSRGR
ncbi:hypothetical protein DCAR_0727110 [Daucus carota subsp. sativus]|uniref:GAG-pre-integrase domain-containing protein n=1 Tax=Daucus carota subsp. sativus TaxID=79200 RepID=A0AAF0XIC0_DAUCS|nr:PREDICTED: uncharacterized protein LOC108194438 [Daucus carota subsp. sativus]WOH07677.1 hypothetical protein DCAR_0727110 [Daucus carota subsp. sativus]